MATRLRAGVRTNDDTSGVTSLELFFDLVFVFALTQVTQLMADDPTWTGAVHGLVVLGLLWFSWTAFAWLGNQARADEGLLRGAVVAAVMAVFVVGLAVPEAFADPAGELDVPLLFAGAFVAVRLLHLLAYLIAAGDDSGLRGQLARVALPTTVFAVLLLSGAMVEGTARLTLWVIAIVIDYTGIFLAGVSGWRLNSARHFAERHGLIIIIAIGESIVAIGVGAADLPLTGAVLLAVTLGLLVSIGLWWTYFDVVAPVAERVLIAADGIDRVRLARDSYTYLHLPMVVGIVFFALGAKKVVTYVADTEHHDLADPLTGMPIAALFAGPALYLLAHVAFRLRNVHSLNWPRVVVVLVLIGLVPVAGELPALAALGLLAGLMVGLVSFEAVRFREARAAVRHGSPQH